MCKAQISLRACSDHECVCVCFNSGCVQRQLLGESSQVCEASNWFTHPFSQADPLRSHSTLKKDYQLLTLRESFRYLATSTPDIGLHYSPHSMNCRALCLYAVSSRRLAETRQTLTNKGSVKVAKPKQTLSVN